MWYQESISGPVPQGESLIHRMRHHSWIALSILALGWFCSASVMGIQKVKSLIRCHFSADSSTGTSPRSPN